MFILRNLQQYFFAQPATLLNPNVKYERIQDLDLLINYCEFVYYKNIT